MATADVVVLGGGSTGTSVAFQLARRHSGKVVLVERDTAGAGPTAKSIGIIRLHYSHEPLIRLAARSLELFARFEELTGAVADFTRCGFLLLAPEPEMDVLRANIELQHRLGMVSSVLAPAEIAALDPRLHLDGVDGAAWEPGSGFADGYATAAGFAAAARREGAEIWETTAAQRLIVDGGRVRAVQTARGEISTPAVLVSCGPWTPAQLGDAVRPDDIHGRIGEGDFADLRCHVWMSNCVMVRSCEVVSPRGNSSPGWRIPRRAGRGSRGDRVTRWVQPRRGLRLRRARRPDVGLPLPWSPGGRGPARVRQFI